MLILVRNKLQIMHLHRNTIAIGLAGLLFALYSCSSASITSPDRKAPSWIKERPVSDEYYIGIGVASMNQDNYMKIAKSNALTDLISEISVTVSGNSVLHQIENEAGFKEEFESYTRTSIKDHLEGYELVDSYTGKGNHWVYYRLSIDKYQRLKREKLEQAKSLAKDFYEKAAEAEQSYNIHNAINYYVKAFEAVKPHLDEDLSIFVLNRGRINLGNVLYQNIQEIFSAIRVEPHQELFRIKALSSGNTAVKATVYYTKEEARHRVSGLPFVFSFPDLDINETEQVESNNSGVINCSIATTAPKGKRQRIKAALNTEVYFGKHTEDNLLYKLFSIQGSRPYGYLTVEVADLLAYFEAEEKMFGQPAAGKPVSNIFRKELTQHFFSLVQERSKADVVVKIASSTTKGKKMDQYDLFTAWLDCNIRVIHSNTGAEVYSTGLQNIKGMKTGSYEMAAQNAREKAQQKIQQKIIPELRNIKF